MAKLVHIKGSVTIHKAVDPETGELFHVLQSSGQYKIAMSPKVSIPITMQESDLRLASRNLSKEDQDAIQRVVEIVESSGRKAAQGRAEEICKEAGLKLE